MVPFTRPNGPELLVEAFKPKFAGELSGISATTSAYFLSGRVPVGQRGALVGEATLSHFSAEGPFTNLSETSFGNPYIGYQRHSRHGFSLELGAHLPLFKDDDFFGGITGVATSFIHRPEAYVLDLLAITSTARQTIDITPLTLLRIHGGPSFLINTDKDDFEDRGELLMRYGGHIRRNFGHGYIAGGLEGIMIVTEGDLSLSERFAHQLFAQAGLHLGSLQPGLYFSLPLDQDLGEITDFVVGLRLSVTRGSTGDQARRN
jgi:hypothetical protein